MHQRALFAMLLSLVACDDAGASPPERALGAGGSSGDASNAGAATVAGAAAGNGGGSSVAGVNSVTAGSAPALAGAASGGAAGGSGGAVEVSSSGAGGSGAPLESPPGFFSGGYLTSGPWMGWVFTYADSAGKGTLVSPVCDANGCVPAWEKQACLKGLVAQDPASSTFVGLAFHNNNPMSGGTGTWTVAGQGVYISLSNPPPAARLQLQEPNTSSNDQRYCAPLPLGGTGVIPFSSFKTYCWGDAAHPSKALALGTQIHETAIVVPGSAASATPFDFCLVDIHPE
ncbi:MAG TPA: hypothetical protein VHB79_35970 [Polyangiaceae bacterium]|nr:hypothetical protein [Polyangiaceae bacterium]